MIASTQLKPLMNNAKWVKLLALLVANADLVDNCRVKLIWEEGEATRQLVFDEHTSYNFDYYDSAMESMITGKPRGWYAYNEIEWLDFPRFIADKHHRQDIEAIQHKIELLGHFKLELSADYLRLYAYLRP